MKNFTKYIILVGIILAICFFLVTHSPSPEKEDSIHIAFVGSLSGPKGAQSGKAMVQAIRLYLDDVNEKGGLHGKKITLDVFDDQNNPSKAKARALEIMDENRALAVIGHNYSSASLSGSEVYKKYHIPAVTPTSTETKLTSGNDWYFRTVFNNQLQARLLANYAHFILQQKTVTIIQEDLPYGSELAKVFKETWEKLGVQVKYIRELKVGDKNLEQNLINIVKELETKSDAGLIFLATHVTEGALLLKLIKDAGLKNLVMVPDAFASKVFPEKFNNYPKEQTNRGYYTNGVYVAAPILFDSASEEAQQFNTIYQAAYQEKPVWHAAFAYDAAIMIVEAIKKAGIQGTANSIQADRKQIRDYLAGLNLIDKAVKGVTGFNYFDEHGNAQKPIMIGVYKNQQLISALTQFQEVRNVNDVPNFDIALKEGRILFIDGRYMYKTNVVYTGIKMNEIGDFDTKNLTYTLDFHLWFRFGGNINPQKIKFFNAVEPIELGEPIDEEVNSQISYRLYQVKGSFKADFRPGYHAVLKKHLLGVSFRHQKLTRDNLIYVTDIMGMGLTTTSALKALKKELAQVFSAADDWTINHAHFYPDIVQKSSLGKTLSGENLEYSRLNTGIEIKKNELSLRGFIPHQWAVYLLVLSVIALLLPVLIEYHRKVKHFLNSIWLLNITFAFVLLLSSEIVLINWLVEENAYYLKYITMGFDSLWWIVLAFALNLLITHFIWAPLERRSGNKIPNVVRRFVAVLIYILAILGIISFVLDRPIAGLMATSGLFAMIIGLAIKENISNIFSGIMINIERPFRMGDRIKTQIGAIFNEGKVIDITWRTTRLLCDDGYIVSIPNGTASDAIIHNYDLSGDTCACQSCLKLRLDYASPPEEIKEILLKAVQDVQKSEGVLKEPEPTILEKPKPTVYFDGFGDGAANYSVRFSVPDYDSKFSVNEVVWKKMWACLKDEGIIAASDGGGSQTKMRYIPGDDDDDDG
jgi:branched-chain amino acid transport system substrate-binding protein